MAERDSADADAGATDEDSEFVFGDDRADTEAPAATESATPEAGGTTNTLTMAVVGIAAALIVVAAGVQLFGPGLAAVLDQGDAGHSGGPAGTTPTDAVATPTPAAGTNTAANARDTNGGTTDGGDATTTSAAGATEGSLKGGGTESPGGKPPGGASPTDGSKMAGSKNGGTAGSETDAGKQTGASGGTDTNTGGSGGFVQTGDGNNRPPVIESTSLVDNSHQSDHGGVLVFKPGWTVTDPDDNLREVQVTLLAHPGGNDTTTLVRRPFPVGGGRNQSTTKFKVPLHDSLGDTYAVRFVVEDQFGNSVNMSRREVANGKDD